VLVLSRQPGESVQLGDDVEITILEVRGSIVKIGIAAPQEVSIYRLELGQIYRLATSDWRKNRRLQNIAQKLRNKTEQGYGN
jgi:carbon storage regulator